MTQVPMTSGDDHDFSGPSDTPYISSPSPAPPRTNPGMSKRAGVDGLRSLQEERPEDHGDDADWQVDEEHPAPRELRHQESPQHGADGGGQRGPQGQDAGCAHSLRRWEDPKEHGHTDRGHHAAAGTLHDAEHDELGHVLGHATEHGAQCEDDDGGQQHTLAAEVVPQPSRRRDEHGQADEVGDDDSVHGRGRYVEVPTDGRERHVHDGDVHDVHEHRGHEHGADDDLLAHAGYGHVVLPVRCNLESGGRGEGPTGTGPRRPFDPIRVADPDLRPAWWAG